MRAEHPGDNKWLDRMGLMIAAPLIVMVGAIVVVILSTPIMIAMTMVVFATALLWMASVVTRQPMTFMVEKEEEMCETADMMVGLEEKTVEMVTALTAASVVPVTATITKVVGPCPLGMMPGNMWKIGPDGKLSRPTCRPGAQRAAQDVQGRRSGHGNLLRVRIRGKGSHLHGPGAGGRAGLDSSTRLANNLKEGGADHAPPSSISLWCLIKKRLTATNAQAASMTVMG